MPWYIGRNAYASTGNATLTSGSATVTSSGAFGSVVAGTLMCFNFTTPGSEHIGWWAVVQTKTNDSTITMDRTAPYSGSVAWKASNMKYDIGNVRDVNIVTATNLNRMPLPFQPSRKTLVFDINGVERRITIRGMLSGTASNIATTINALNEIQDGSQTTNKTLLCIPLPYYHSGNGAWYQVAITNLSVQYLVPNGTLASYNMECLERY